MSTIFADTFVLYTKIKEERSIIDLSNNRISNDSYFGNFYDKVIKNTYLHSKRTSFLLWRGLGYIHQLDHLNFDQETIQHLNDNGLSIYLYEVFIYSKTLDEIVKPSRSDTLKTFVEKTYSNLLYDFDHHKIKNLYSAELESIKRFVSRVGLTRVTVHSCHYKLNDKFLSNYDSFQTITDNVCLPMLVNYINSLYSDGKEKNSFEIKKRFICPLWRYSAVRHLLASFMISNNSRYLSWYYKGSVDTLKNNLWFDVNQIDTKIRDRIISGVHLLEKNVPIAIDSVTDGSFVELTGEHDFLKHPPGYEGYYIENVLENYYESSFCAIAAETIYAQPFATFSEKTMIAMKCRRPFIIVGAPYTLEYLKSFGFKTFDRWWNESYDQEEDHATRILQIFELIDFISNLSNQQIKQIFDEMQEVLDYNYRLVSDVNTFDKIKGSE
jgi:uncharacterized protein YeeX (DUF496 family)